MAHPSNRRTEVEKRQLEKVGVFWFYTFAIYKSMKQKVAFNSLTDITLREALALAVDSFPTEDFSGINTAIELENKINSMDQTLYVDIDTDRPVIAALEAEAELKAQVDADVDSLNCDIPPTTDITADDIENTDLCAEPNEFPVPIIVSDSEITDLLKTLVEEQRKKFGSLEDPNSEGPDETKDLLSCVSSMTDITSALVALNNKERNINNTLINLEEFLYNYRIMEAYFKKRVQTIDQLLGLFDPLITQERDYQSQIDIVSPQEAQAKKDLDDAKARLQAQTGSSTSGSSGVSGVSGVSGTSSNTNTSTTTSTTSTSTSNTSTGSTSVETQQHVDLLQSAYNTLHIQLVDLQNKLKDVKDKITADENAISPFLNEINFEKTQAFLDKNNQEQEEARLQWLNDNLNNLFNGGSTAFSRVATFSTRTTLKQNPGSASNQSFLLNIQFQLIDAENILAGRTKTYTQTSQNTTIDPFDGNTPHGILYDKLYNIWGDVELYFTREERGLTANSNFAAPQLKGTGAEAFKSNFIADTGNFRNFYENFAARHRDKTTFVKTTIIEPALLTIVGDLEELAIKEVQYLFAFGKAFENLPAESTKLTDIITAVRTSSEIYTARILELRTDLGFVMQAHKNVLDAIEKKKQEYLQVPCAMNIPNPPEKDPVTPGEDPLGANTMQNIYPDDPDPTKYCYWVKFAAFATAVNILPLPGNGGFKYWPIGLQIPNPSGITNIPLPIIWIPVAVIVLTAGIFVIFIGQCGICPSPFVLYIGPNGEKKFIISLRPTDEFGAKADEAIIKTIDKGGIAIKTSMNAMLNKINIPGFKPIGDPDGASTILDDTKDKIIKKINKIGIPDITPLTSKLTTHSTIADKRAALKEVVNKYLDKLTLPTIKIPKNAANVNPKPLPMLEVVNQLVKLFKMDLPQIAIPAADKINLKTKLISKIGEIKTSELPSINIPPIDFNTATPDDQNKWSNKIKDALKNGAAVGHLKITPKELGLTTSVLGSGIIFINPYKCKPGAKGLAIPPLSPTALVGLGAVKIAADALIDGLTISQLKVLLKSTGGALTTGLLTKTLTGTLAALPNVEIPNPSKISIKDMMKDSSLKIVKMQLPSLPDPTKPPQIQIPLPGEALKGIVKTAVISTIDVFPLNDIDLSKMSGIDVKQLVITMMETSFKPVEDFLNPFLKIISNYKASKDKTFAELLGLKKVDKDDNLVTTVTKESMDGAIIALKALALVPYPAVAFLPEAFKKLHPILSSDDLPPWKRFTLDNFLFVTFLDQFCSQGKKGGGFLENP